MRSAKIHPINESDHWAEYAELQPVDEEPDRDDPWAVFISVCLCIVAVGVVAEIIRAIIRWPYWSQVLR